MSTIGPAFPAFAKGNGKASPRADERVTALQNYASDPKFKKYTQQVEKCLNAFDNVSEWADFIAFLKQLLKTFQSYMQFKEIPRKLIVAKRLAQCLNPALPNGVHQRALDVYAHILAVLGSEGLRRDIALWSAGLFPFFEYAATSVKPTLLNLYDTHYLPLQSDLRPVMKSFILALLPGLEEETGEFFDKVVSLLDRLSGTVSMSFFFQNIWLIMLTAPTARGTSINFLARRLPQFNADEDITTIIGRDIGLMIRAFAAALEDDNLLVRRGALDLLLQAMKVDSVAVRRAQPDDRTILMRASTSVVLRRDLALNRRLYTWLLGPDERSEAQMDYLTKNSLELLRLTLKEEMMAPSGDYSESRPFKIFISLLDKWEIGAPLTDALVYDAFAAIKRYMDSKADNFDDILMTASTLYEAVEPHIVWKKLLQAVLSDLIATSEEIQGIEMTRFIMKNFVQDEEIQTLHLPVVFGALLDVLDVLIGQDSNRAASLPVRHTMLLLEEMLQNVPHLALFRQQDLQSHENSDMALKQRPYKLACSHFGVLPTLETPEGNKEFTMPFCSALESLVTLSSCLGQAMTGLKSAPKPLREVYEKLLDLTSQLVSRLSLPAQLSWNPKEWTSTVISVLEHELSTFTLVDRTVSLMVLLHQKKELEPSVSIDQRTSLLTMLRKLLHYLHPQHSAFHVRATALIWTLESISGQRHVESILAQSMTSPDSRKIQDAYEAFGTLWRLSEDNIFPGFRLKVPTMMVLDSLRGDNPDLRRIAETWMRCSLKSYLRVLDPILFDLLDPTIRRSSSQGKVNGRDLQGFTYDTPFDQRYVNHLLDLLLSVARFGGQNFAKTIRSTSTRRSQHGGLTQRLSSTGFGEADMSYLEVLVELLLRFLQSEPKPEMTPTMQPNNSIIQSTAAELLQVFVSRGEIDMTSVHVVENAVIMKLYFCIHLTRLDLQNKLLHLLHSLISVATINEEAPARLPKAADEPTTETKVHDAQLYSINPLLVQTLVDGIATPSNRAVLQHWLDFVLMAVPQFQPALQPVVIPLNECICEQLSLSLQDVLSASSRDGSYTDDLLSSTTDAELIMLLNSLERLVLLSLAYTAENFTTDEELAVSEKSPQQDNSGLLGNVFGVFSSDTPGNINDELLSARSPGYKALDDGVQILYLLWAQLIWDEPGVTTSRDDSLVLIYSRSRGRCRRVLEHLFRVHSAEVLESTVECWYRYQLNPTIPDDPAFELVDLLVSSAQNAVHMLCEAITCRLTGASEKSKRQAINPNLSESVLFSFLEQYLCRLEGPLALQVWGRFLQMAKDIVSGSKDFKSSHYTTLRCITVLSEKLSQTSAMEDKRIKKEMQDTFGRLLDSCVAYVGRSYDSGSWIRRSTKDPVASGRESPQLRAESRALEEKPTTSTPLPTPDPGRNITGLSNDIVGQINDYLATTAISNLRRFLSDSDRVVTVCTNIVYYIISPAMRGKTKPMDVELAVVRLLQEITRLPAALKAWKSPVVELINDNRLFNCSSNGVELWKPIIKSLYDADKTAFPELLAKVAAAPSANIFTNREHELLLRSLNLRRLAFVIFTGEKNHFLTMLPTIQEKLVDTFRSVSAPVVQSELFLCIRVLLCRLSSHNMTSFWPVVLTEMIRVFEGIMLNLPSDGSEELQVVLAASKCLDLLLVLQTEEFQIYQWIFITDTVDAIYRPDNTNPIALMDQLAEVAGSLPIGSIKDAPNTNGVFSPGAQQPGSTSNPLLRRPLLGSLRQIDSIRDLVPFFSTVSMSSYEGVYMSGGNVDWVAVENGLVEDMFEGR